MPQDTQSPRLARRFLGLFSTGRLPTFVLVSALLLALICLVTHAERVNSANFILNPSYVGEAEVPPIILTYASSISTALYLQMNGTKIGVHTYASTISYIYNYEIDMSATPLKSLAACKFENQGFVIVGTTRDNSTTFVESYRYDTALDTSRARLDLGPDVEDASIAYVLDFSASPYIVVAFVNTTTSKAQYIIYSASGLTWGEVRYAGDVSSVLEPTRNFVQLMPRVMDYRNDRAHFAIVWLERNLDGSGNVISWFDIPKLRQFEIFSATTLTSSTNKLIYHTGVDESYEMDGSRHLRLFESSGGTQLMAAWARTYRSITNPSQIYFESVFLMFGYSANSDALTDFKFYYTIENKPTMWPMATVHTMSTGLSFFSAGHFSTELSRYKVFSRANNGSTIGEEISPLTTDKNMGPFSTMAPAVLTGATGRPDSAFDVQIVSITNVDNPSRLGANTTNPVILSQQSHPLPYTYYDDTRPFGPWITQLTPGYGSSSQMTYDFTAPPEKAYDDSIIATTDLFTGNIVLAVENGDSILIREQDPAGTPLATYLLPPTAKRPSIVALRNRYLVIWDQFNSTRGIRQIRGQYFLHAPTSEISVNFIISADNTNASFASIDTMNGTSSAADGFLVAYVDVSDNRRILGRFVDIPYTTDTFGWLHGPEILINLYGHAERIVSTPRVARIGNSPRGKVMVLWMSRNQTNSLTGRVPDTELMGQYMTFLSIPGQRPFMHSGPQITVSLPSGSSLRTGDLASFPAGNWMYRSNLQAVGFRNGPHIAYTYQEERRDSAGNPTTGSRIITGMVSSWFHIPAETVADSWSFDARSPSIAPFGSWKGKAVLLCWERRASGYAGIYWRAVYPLYSILGDVNSVTSKRAVEGEEEEANALEIPLRRDNSASFARPAVSILMYDPYGSSERRFGMFYFNGEAPTAKVNYKSVNFVSRYDYAGIAPSPYRDPDYEPTPEFFTPSKIKLLKSLPGIIIGCVFGVIFIITISCLAKAGCLTACCCPGKSSSNSVAGTPVAYTTTTGATAYSTATTTTTTTTAAAVDDDFAATAYAQAHAGYGDEVEMVPIPPAYTETGVAAGQHRHYERTTVQGDIEADASDEMIGAGAGAGAGAGHNTLFRPY